MTTEYHPLPKLHLFFPCQDAAINLDKHTNDLQYGWWEIQKPLNHVYFPAGVKKGFCASELGIFYQLSSGLGDYQFFIELHELDLATPKRDRLHARSESVNLRCSNELEIFENVVIMKDVPFPKPGMYRLRMLHSGNVLEGGEFILRVFAGE
jgi:hypothetical protein